MTHPLGPVALLAVGVVLAACGEASTPRVEPDVASSPTWGGCSQFSVQMMSIAEGARGTSTLTAAVGDYREGGDHLVTAPVTGGLPHRWLVRADGTIHADLEAWHSRRGWFVTGVKRCADH